MPAAPASCLGWEMCYCAMKHNGWEGGFTQLRILNFLFQLGVINRTSDLTMCNAIKTT